MEYKTVRYEIQVKGPLGFFLAAGGLLLLERATKLYQDFASDYPDTEFRMLRIETVTTVVKTTTEEKI